MTTRNQVLYTTWFDDISANDVAAVGGKNASLGEMIRSLSARGIKVPGGFAVTSAAYWSLLDANQMKDEIEALLDLYKSSRLSLGDCGKAIRKLFYNAQFPEDVAGAISENYRELNRRYEAEDLGVAVRSSATAEDLPDASFAGQQDTFLNVVGEADLFEACRNCYASLFTDRAISYREAKGFAHLEVALSIGVQKMVRSDRASAGVMFTVDPESGFDKVVVINASWGLGEGVVQGIVTPDEYVVFKPLLADHSLIPILSKRVGSKESKVIYANGGGGKGTKSVATQKPERRSLVLEDCEILQLATWACEIENHYGKAMDIEWAKDGEDGALYIVQARPETVRSKDDRGQVKSYRLKASGKKILKGFGIGEAIASGKAMVLRSASDIERFEDGSVLVTEMTDPDWVPIMQRASAIVTDLGGRTSHAAIVSRELGIPAIVGTGDGTEQLKTGQSVTVSCAEGDHGYVYDGVLDFEVSVVDLNSIPATRTRLGINMADPAMAFRWWRLPVDGIGLARMEFIINNEIRVHPMALVRFDLVRDAAVRAQIETLTFGYSDKKEYFVDRLAQGISRIAASRFPDPVIVRMSDFKTNEYANLIGGKQFEMNEENPMLGFRGASRYYSERYRDAFGLECQAIRRVREGKGLSNVIVMIPFCRTPEEGERVLKVMAKNGLNRGENGLQIYVMAEVPSNIILAKEFAKRFDGFSIGSNDLTQLVLGVDRDSSGLAHLFDERHRAVKSAIVQLIKSAHKASRKVGICGQAPSDYPKFSEFLVKCGIDSISLNPDSFIAAKLRIAKAEGDFAAKARSTGVQG
jgi:pyruvate,water dikinase